MWVGIDDTDGPDGGCTTWVLTEVVRCARRHALDVLGEPRLVRLNPNVPWRTRGNGALAVRLGRGRGPSRLVGALDGRPCVAYARGAEVDPPAAERFARDAWRAVDAASPRVPGTDPAMVVLRRAPPASLYWRAVRERVAVAEVERELRHLGATVRVRSARRGLVGATAAVAWPGLRHTWELLAYREPARVGTPRSVDGESVRAAQRSDPGLFLCHDARTRRLLVAPHTGCPILFGLRGTRRSAPLQALGSIRSEPIERWMLFRTNQATGDHLVRRPAAEVTGLRSATVDGTVVAPAVTSPGGHASFAVQDRAGTPLACVAFEPTKTLPAVARRLAAGDRVRVWGSRGRDGGFRLEGITVLRLARLEHRRPPRCRACGRTAGSMGRARGYRCPQCGRRFPPEAARTVGAARALRPGTYHPTPSARRHLAPRGPES